MKEFKWWGRMEFCRQQMNAVANGLAEVGERVLPTVMAPGLNLSQAPVDSFEAECMTLATLLNGVSHVMLRLRKRWLLDEDSRWEGSNGR